MTDDILIAEAPSRDRSLPVPPADVTRWMADEYSRSSAERLYGGHGESLPLPLPAVSGASGQPPIPPSRPPTAVNPDPRHKGGLMVPAEYVLAEGGIANGKALTHHAILRNPEAAHAIGLLADSRPATLDGVVASIQRIRAENEQIDALIGRTPEPPTPPDPAPEPPRPSTQTAPRTLPRDPVAFTAWTMTVVVLIWAAVLTSITVWVY